MSFAQDTHITKSLPGERIAKRIARSGLCSRRDAERLIADGHVTLNGKKLENPAINVTSEDEICVNGAPLPAAELPRLWKYHKPKGRVTTHRDPQGRPTVFQALPDAMPRVISIGRLDFNTEGLLLLTNDGALARHLESPSTGWLRRYRVRANGKISQKELDRLAGGVEIEGIRYGPVEAKLDRPQGANVWLTLGLREGKNREVRKIMEHLGLTVNRLIRLSFGPFHLGELAVGAVEEIKRRVVAEQLGEQMAASLGLTQKRQNRSAAARSGTKSRNDAAGKAAGRHARPSWRPKAAHERKASAVRSGSKAPRRPRKSQ